MKKNYYQKFMNNEIDDSLLQEPLKDMSFEDHFWHMACLSLLYREKKDEYLERQCVKLVCDLSFAYTAMHYFDQLKCLPKGYQKYLPTFKNSMKNEKIDNVIKGLNKRGKNQRFKAYMIYSLLSLLVIPLMLIMVLVFKVSSEIAVIVSIAFLLGSQFLLNPTKLMVRRKQKHNMNRIVDKDIEKYFNFYARFHKILSDPLYIRLIQLKKKEDIEKQVELIKVEKKI